MSVKHNPKHVIQWVLVLLFFAVGNFLVSKNAFDFQASVILTNQAPPFDGTVMPIQRTPMWTSLTSDQYKMSYDQIPATKMQPIPVYDPNVLQTHVEQLGWTSASDLAIRNAKITYSVPYMGDYKLDGLENAGSHLAVDIKIPMNTPVFAIANGVVIKVSHITTGFGNHIVIRHDNAPSFGNPGVKTTYYSSYNHLASILVSEGDVVLKGQQIGFSGESGDATTPHMHFQIDNDQAPWHPYWPFTYLDAQAAGYSFFEAINAGLGRDRALATTVNPLMYVQKYLNGSVAPVIPTVSSPTPSLPATTSPAVTGSPEVSLTQQSSTQSVSPDLNPTNPTPSSSVSTGSTQVDNSITTPSVISSPPATISVMNPATSLKIAAGTSFVVGVNSIMTIQAIDASGKTVTDYKPSNGVGLTVANGSASLVKTYFRPEEFQDGAVTTVFTPTGFQSLRFHASDGQISGDSDTFQSTLFSDIKAKSDLIAALSFLKNHDVINGYPDGSFKPDNVVSRVEALKFILKGVNKNLQAVGRLPFKDTDSSQWYANYVATAYNGSIISGYSDLTFRPAKTVNRAEFLKMLLLAMDIKPDTHISANVFHDVPAKSWYAPYVQYAKDKNLIDSGSNMFKPEEGMTRGEVADIIYRMILIKLTGQPKYMNGLVVSNTAADEYFRRNS